MSPKVWDGPRNLHSKFGHNRVNKIWDIPDMDKCCQDICCLDKCCRYSWNLFKMVTGRHKVCSGVGEGWWWWWCAKSFSCKTQLLVTLSCGWVGALTIFFEPNILLNQRNSSGYRKFFNYNFFGPKNFVQSIDQFDCRKQSIVGRVARKKTKCAR